MTGPVQGGGGLRGFNWSTGSYPGTPLRVGMASALNGTEEAWLEHLPKRLFPRHGGGIRGGLTYGATDELVYPRTSNRIPAVASVSFRDMIRLRAPTALYLYCVLPVR